MKAIWVPSALTLTLLVMNGATGQRRSIRDITVPDETRGPGQPHAGSNTTFKLPKRVTRVRTRYDDSAEHQSIIGATTTETGQSEYDSILTELEDLGGIAGQSQLANIIAPHRDKHPAVGESDHRNGTQRKGGRSKVRAEGGRKGGSANGGKGGSYTGSEGMIPSDVNSERAEEIRKIVFAGGLPQK